jgi:hypothetical protein
MLKDGLVGEVSLSNSVVFPSEVIQSYQSYQNFHKDLEAV